MTKRVDGGEILSKETYNYEFDTFGNWTKMLTSLVVFEAEELKREPVEATYRTLTYYFDDSVAKITDSPSHRRMAAILPPSSQIRSQGVRTQLYQLESKGVPPLVLVGDIFSSVRVNVADPPPEIN